MNAKKRWLSALIAAVMLIACLPVYALAAETGVMAETVTAEQITVNREKFGIEEDEEYGVYTFTTLEDLQQLAAGTYSEFKVAWYEGTEPLVFTSDLVIPENLYVAVDDGTVKIPAGVTVTSADSMSVGDLIVEGTLNALSIDVSKSLTVTGAVNCEYGIYVNDSTSISGLDKVSGVIYYGYYIESMTELKAAIAAAEAQTDSRVRYDLVLFVPLILNESITVPNNCSLDVIEPTTVSQGCTLTVNCNVTMLENVLTVNGKLVNGSSLNIYSDYGGKLVIDGGSYEEEGYGAIWVWSNTLTSPDAAFSGLDLANFEIEEYDYGYGKEWGLFLKKDTEAPHVHVYNSTVTAPTCVSQGYTTYTCTCGDSYVDDYVQATGEHTYTDEQDVSCDVCGALKSLPVAPEGADYTPMYRLYNPNSGEHFYTGSVEETTNLAVVGWIYEGVAWNAPTNTGDSVYRLYNPNSTDHHYTMSWEEVEMLKKAGWQYEGVAWNSASSDDVPQYRLYNPNAECGIHHYTSSTEERDNLVGVGWIFEGIGWYGIA